MQERKPPIDYQEIIIHTVTHGLGFPPDLPNFGVPEVLWRYGERCFRVSKDPDIAKRVGQIGAFIEQAVEEGLEGQISFEYPEDFYLVLDRFIKLRDTYFKQSTKGVGKYVKGPLRIKDLLPITPVSMGRV